MISAENLSFSYGSRPILRKISFTADQGEFISLLGPNGVGKSTLLRCLLGLLRGYTGCIRLEDKDIRTLSAREMAHRVAYIPQSGDPTFNYTVMEMVLMGTTHQVRGFSAPRETEIATAREALEQIDIIPLADRSYGRLSGGERQLVLIARALAQQAKILIMDEPTSNLDYGNQLRVLQKVRALSRRGYTVLLSSHNPQQALLFSDRALAMSEGQIIADGKPDAVVDEELLRTLYGVEAKLCKTPEGRFVIPILREEE